MAQWLYWTLPMPVVARPGGAVALDTILSQSFGGIPAEAPRFALAYFGLADMARIDFDFWQPDQPQVDRWFYRKSDIGAGFVNQIQLRPEQTRDASMVVGNTIGPVSFMAIPVAGSPGNWTQYIEYSVMTIDPSLMLAGAGKKAPVAADLVAQAYRFAKAYGTPVNSNDCHLIAAAVAASAGATFVAGLNTQNVVDPGANIEHGFWRIAYRGSDPGTAGNWQSLVEPGDIVRMGWKAGGFHTVTILSVSKDKNTIKVYDNTNVGGTIGIHDVNFNALTKPGSITIYRLTRDNLYLENGTDRGERLPGTIFNDKVLGQGGDDHLFGAGGHDVLDGGTGDDVLDGGVGDDLLTGGPGRDTLIGGAGTDTASYANAAKGVAASLLAPTSNTGDAAGDTYQFVENLTGSRFADRLEGSGGGNALQGGEGADTLVGGAGADRLDCGRDGQTDTIVFAKGDSGTNAATWDTIVNFRADTDGKPGVPLRGADRIDLRGIDADPAPGDQVLRFVSKFQSPTKSQADGQVCVVDAGDHVNVQVDWNGDNRVDMIIQVMNVARLTADDFLL